MWLQIIKVRILLFTSLRRRILGWKKTFFSIVKDVKKSFRFYYINPFIFNNFFKEGFLFDFIWKKHIQSILLDFLIVGALNFNFNYFSPLNTFRLFHSSAVLHFLESTLGSFLFIYLLLVLVFVLFILLTLLILLY